jgi:hypothetical protein
LQFIDPMVIAIIIIRLMNFLPEIYFSFFIPVRFLTIAKINQWKIKRLLFIVLYNHTNNI